MQKKPIGIFPLIKQSIAFAFYMHCWLAHFLWHLHNAYMLCIVRTRMANDIADVVAVAVFILFGFTKWHLCNARMDVGGNQVRSKCMSNLYVSLLFFLTFIHWAGEAVWAHFIAMNISHVWRKQMANSPLTTDNFRTKVDDYWLMVIHRVIFSVFVNITNRWRALSWGGYHSRKILFLLQVVHFSASAINAVKKFSCW